MISCIYLVCGIFWLFANCYVIKCNEGGYTEYPFYLMQKEIIKDYIYDREKEIENLKNIDFNITGILN